MDSGRHAVLLAGVANVHDCLDQFGIVAFQRHTETKSHRGGKIVGTDETGIHSRHAQDLVGVLDTLICSIWRTTSTWSLAFR